MRFPLPMSGWLGSPTMHPLIGWYVGRQIPKWKLQMTLSVLMRAAVRGCLAWLATPKELSAVHAAHAHGVLAQKCSWNEGLSDHADPLANDENFLLCMLMLEELGATGNKACCYHALLHASDSLHLSSARRNDADHPSLLLQTILYSLQETLSFAC